MDRRVFVQILVGGIIAAPLLAHSQAAKRIWRIGILDLGLPRLFAAFRESMRDLGYADGQNVEYDVRSAQGKPEEVAALATGLVEVHPDVIVTAGLLSSRSLMRATTTIPIVIAAMGDAISAGIVDNLAHPRGNVTGISFLNNELSGKRLELLKEALPRLHRVATFNDPTIPQSFYEATETTAKLLRLRLQRIDIRAPHDFDRAYRDARKGGAQAVIVLASAFFDAHRGRLVELALQARLPAIYHTREYAEAGGLMTYGTDLVVLFREAAIYVDKILKGAKPVDLPWEQPTKFELVINLKTAKALGITISQSLLLRADEVIQ